MSHIAPVSFKVATTLAANRVVTALSSSANTVAYPEGVTRPYIGITLDTVLDTTTAIPVAIGGIAKLYFNDSCVSGQLVGADTSGRGIAWGSFGATTTAITNTTAYIGVLLGAKVETTGTIAEVLIQPGFARK